MEKSKKRFKILKILLSAVLLIALVWTICALLPRGDNYAYDNPMMKEGELPIAVAHRGGNGEFPGNTLEACYNAYHADPNIMIETDACITKDGVVILSHNTTIDKCTDHTGKVIDWNYSDMIAQKVDFGYNNSKNGKVLRKYTDGEGNTKTPLDVVYPEGITARDDTVFLATTLEELLSCFPDNLISVEVKQSGEAGIQTVDEIMRLLEKYDAFDRVVVTSFHDEVYQEYMSLREEGTVPDSLLFAASEKGTIRFMVLQLLRLDIFFTDETCVFKLPMERYGYVLSKESIVRDANRHNIGVHYWTINEESEMRELIELGADAICTDYPHRLMAVYEEY